MKKRIIRLMGAMAVAGASVATGVFGGGTAHADTSLIGWTAQADANMFALAFDNGAGLAGSHPLTEIDLPEDLSNYQTGPLGHALATMVWPGPVAGNIGSLAGEVGLPSQLLPITDMLNDPARAESFYPAGPADATYPPGAPATGGLEMTSHADANGAWAKAAIADAVVPQLFTLQTVQGSTTANAATVAQSTASGAFHSLSLLGGAIQIGASTSTASAQSDGNNPSGTSTSNIGAITIAGQPVSVGTNGIVVGPASSSLSGLLSAAPSDLANQVISALNLKIVPLPQTETTQGGAEQITSAGLQVSFSLPSNLSVRLDCTSLPSQLAQLGVLCTVPDLLQGFNFTLTIGRVTAEAIAAPPFAISLDQSGLGLLSDSGSATSPGGSFGVDLSSLPTGSVTPAGGGSVPGQSIRKSSPISLSSPMNAGLLVGLLAAATLFGVAFRRLAAGLGAPPTELCPQEEP